jgi:hypothetical protein
MLENTVAMALECDAHLIQITAAETAQLLLLKERRVGQLVRRERKQQNTQRERERERERERGEE